jgi:hypothetical protein
MYPANRRIREFDHGVGIDLALLSVRPSCLGQLSERASEVPAWSAWAREKLHNLAILFLPLD